jgi:hypothetical protein
MLTLIAILYVDWDEVLSRFGRQHLLAVLLVQPIQFMLVFILGLRFSILSTGRIRSSWAFFESYLLSVGLNSFFPGRVSEFVKVSYLKENLGLPVATTLAALFLEKLTDMFYLGAIVLFGGGALWLGVDKNYILISLFLLLILLLIIPRIERIVLRNLDRLPCIAFREVVKKVVANVTLRINVRELSIAMMLGIVAWIMSFILVWAVVEYLHGKDIDFAGVVIVFSAMVVGRAIPGLPSGIGTFEAAVIFAMKPLGFNVSDAIATALTLHAAQIAFVTLVSLIILGVKGAGVKSLLDGVRRLMNEG